MTKSDEILLMIHESYYNNLISENEYDQLLYEFTKKEYIRIAGRKGARVLKSTYGDLITETKNAFTKVTSKDKNITVSDVGKIAGITTSWGLQIALTALAGPLDYLIHAAVVLVTVPLKDYNFSYIDPIYRSTTKPFLDEIINRHQTKAEGIVHTAKSLKQRIDKTIKNIDKIEKSQYDKTINDLVKNMYSSAKEIDRFRLKIQRELTKLEVKIQEQLNVVNDNKRRQVSNADAYKKLNKLKARRGSLEETKQYFNNEIRKYNPNNSLNKIDKKEV